MAAPLASSSLTQPSNANLFLTTISAAQTPGSIPLGQTWTYQATYRNGSLSISFTYVQQSGGIVPITDWNGSTQQCYALVTIIDLLQLYTAMNMTPPYPGIISSGIQISWIYINTTNYSIPRSDALLVAGLTNGTSAQAFGSVLANVTLYLYKFPLSSPWQNVANTSLSGWTIDANGYKQTYGPYTGNLTNISASVSAPTSVTVPAGIYEAYPINYLTGDSLVLLFGGVIGLALNLTSPQQIQGWYSLDAQNFVKIFLDYGSSGNVTVELLSTSNPLQTLILLSASYFFYNAQQQQGFSRLLLIGGGVAAAVAIAAIAIFLFRRRG